jgi:hypothetical protein
MSQAITIEQAIENLRKMPIFRQLVPQEAGIGWPIPLRKEQNGVSRVYVTFPLFGLAPRVGQNQTVLFPPFATITLDWATQVPVEYVSLHFNHPWPEGQWEGEVGTFPHAAIAHMTVGEYKAKRSELLALYDEMFERLAQKQAFSAEWIARFSELLRLLMEPSLEPYYRALGPKFFSRFLGANHQVTTPAS